MGFKEKESYIEPVLTTHDLLRDITGVKYREKTGDKPGD